MGLCVVRARRKSVGMHSRTVCQGGGGGGKRERTQERKSFSIFLALSLFLAAALYSRERSNGSVYTFRFWAEWDGGEDDEEEEEEEEATLSGPHFPPSWRKPAARHFSFPSLEEEPPPPGVELMHALLLFYQLTFFVRS